MPFITTRDGVDIARAEDRRLVTVPDLEHVPRPHGPLDTIDVDDIDGPVVAVVAPELPLRAEDRSALAVDLHVGGARSLDQDEADTRLGSLGTRHQCWRGGLEGPAARGAPPPDPAHQPTRSGRVGSLR